jgi:hypothetical protein
MHIKRLKVRHSPRSRGGLFIPTLLELMSFTYYDIFQNFDTLALGLTSSTQEQKPTTLDRHSTTYRCPLVRYSYWFAWPFVCSAHGDQTFANTNKAGDLFQQ